MADNRAILSAFRNELVAQSIVRRATQTTPAGKPPMWLQPDTAPAPGDPVPQGVTSDPAITLTARIGGDIVPPPGHGSLHKTTIDVIYRTAKDQAGLAFDVDVLIRAAIAGQPAEPFGKLDWTMGGLHVIQTKGYAGLAPLGPTSQGGTDHVSKFYVEAWA